MNRFDAVQAAARSRIAATISSEDIARQIVAAANGDVRIAYDCTDTITAHVTRLLREKTND